MTPRVQDVREGSFNGSLDRPLLRLEGLNLRQENRGSRRRNGLSSTDVVFGISDRRG